MIEDVLKLPFDATLTYLKSKPHTIDISIIDEADRFSGVEQIVEQVEKSYKQKQLEEQQEQQHKLKQEEIDRVRSLMSSRGDSSFSRSGSSRRASEDPTEYDDTLKHKSAPVSRRMSELPHDESSEHVTKRGSEPFLVRATSPTRAGPTRVKLSDSPLPRSNSGVSERQQGDTVRNMFQRVLSQDSKRFTQ